MTPIVRPVVHRSLELAAELRPRVLQQLVSSPESDRLRSLATAVSAATATELSDDDFADVYSQSLACGAAVTRLAGPLFHDGLVRNWVLEQAHPFWKGILEESFQLSLERDALQGSVEYRTRVRRPQATNSLERGGLDPILAFYELFLQRHDQRRRTRHGVFYTPPPIARYILSQVHRCLVDEFGLEDGLADAVTWAEMTRRVPSLSLPTGARPADPFVRILDPALGTGVFLAEGLRFIHAQWTAKWAAAGESAGRIADRWDEYVAALLLPRLCGLELMLPACVVATLKLVVVLAETGFSFRRPARLEIALANTLAGPSERQRSLFAAPESAFLAAATAGRDGVCRTPFTVIVGNPPFSGISQQQGRWIVDLLRGREDGRDRWCNYFEVDGRPLGERKTWLQDDYVKFLRFAHWKVETAGCGIVGLVTNHGYLDNPTFRGVRRQLLTTFPRITVIDLHGNRKKKERAPDGRQDENVFAIEQGTAIGLMRRPPAEDAGRELWHGELWGDAEQKLRALDDTAKLAASDDGGLALSIRRVVPAAPNYFFAPRTAPLADEYDGAPRLPDLMPVNVTAPVTARDSFVVAFTREELLARLAEFRDLSVPDDEIRRRYFTRTRSARYAPGDTRGWKLAVARRRLAADPRWQEYVQPCWYRPFDERLICWADGMIDWPRNEVMPYLVRPGNLALVARRQMLPTQPCNYFWITDQLLLDGLIRSDNRGSESVFPLFLEAEAGGRGTRSPRNFAEAHLEAAARQMGIHWQSGDEKAGDGFRVEDVLYYSYALFFSPTYRLRYADRLWSDFPRVLWPRRPGLFCELAGLGRRLVDRHLLTSVRPAASGSGLGRDTMQDAGDWRWSIHAAPCVAPGFPKYASGRMNLNRDAWLEPVPLAVWEFFAGGHQVCRKWLKDRRGRTLVERELAVYLGIVAAIDDTLRITAALDAAVDAAGGWPGAFAPAETCSP